MSDDIVTRLRAYNIGNIAHEASSHMEETLYEAADEVERLRADRDHYWATTNDATSERNHWVRLFKLAFNSHFDKTWDGETADLLGQSYDEAECICGDDKL